MNPIALIVENDQPFAQRLADTLTSYGLQPEILSDGNLVLEHTKGVNPNIILLCVELGPLNGYSICNRLKKNPDLAAIPLIIMSSQATADTFEQHRRLKTRAEDYIHKPFSTDQLVEKIRYLIDLPEYTGTGEETMSSGYAVGTGPQELDLLVMDDDSEAVEIMDDLSSPMGALNGDIHDEMAEPTTGLSLTLDDDGSGFSESDGQPQTEVGKNARERAQGTFAPSASFLGVDREVDLQTDAAFDAIGAPSSTPAPQVISQVQTNVSEDGANTGAQSQQHRDLARQLEQLRSENEQLSNALKNAETRAASAGTAAPRDRELLGLREVINKKEKEVLDLKDDVDAKERQILDHREKVRELERKARDLEEKLLAVERELVNATDRVDALTQDKQRSVEREAATKTRLDEAKREIDKSYSENETLKARHHEELQQANNTIAQLQGQVAQLSSTVDELQERHPQEIAQLKQAHQQQLDATVEAKEIEQANALHQLRQTHQAELEKLDQSHQNQIEEDRAAHKTKLAELTAANERSLSDLQMMHARALNSVAEERDALSQQLQQQNERISNVEADLERTAQAVVDRERTIAQKQQEIERAQAQSALLREQIAKNDEFADKAKRAMAVAIALLDQANEPELESSADDQL